MPVATGPTRPFFRVQAFGDGHAWGVVPHCPTGALSLVILASFHSGLRVAVGPDSWRSPRPIATLAVFAEESENQISCQAAVIRHDAEGATSAAGRHRGPARIRKLTIFR